MKEMINNIDWKKVRLNTIKILFLVILNTALWVYLIGSFVPKAKIGEFRLSWIDYLRLSDKIAWYHIWLLYIGIAVGIMLSMVFLKFWYKEAKDKKEKQEQKEQQEANTLKIVEAINASKENKKIESIVDKRLKGK